MCQILYKPVGVELPTLAMLNDAASSNPHGIGFMYPNNEGKVSIYKMRMSAAMAYDLLTNLADCGIDWVATPLVLHFRMATHGNTSDANCHPFPITKDDALLSAKYCQSDLGLAHNGVVYIAGVTKNSDKSDTYTMVQEYFHDFTFDTFKHAHKLIDEELLKCDRMIVMNGEGEVIQWGRWHDNKNIQSSTWMGYRTITGGRQGRGFNYYDYDCYDGCDGYGLIDYTPDDYPERGQITSLEDYRKTTNSSWKETCDICRYECGNTTHYRDDCTMCSSCYKALYQSAHSYGRVKKDKETGVVTIGEMVIDNTGNNKQSLEDYLGKGFPDIYLEDGNGLVRCSCCELFVPKEDVYTFQMKTTYIGNPKAKTQVMCNDCFEMLCLDIQQLALDDAIEKIIVGERIGR